MPRINENGADRGVPNALELDRSAGIKLTGVLLLLLSVGQGAEAFQQDSNETPFNFSSEAGVPLSTTPGDPAGSNGLAPTVESQREKGLTENPPTEGQFQSVVNFSHSLSVTNMPASTGLKFHLSGVRMGLPYFAQAETFLFGEVIPRPSVDVDGNDLTVDASDYWNPEPVNAGDDDVRFYWSPHAGSVFATDVGTVPIQWRTLASQTATPTGLDGLESGGVGADDDGLTWFNDSGNYYRVLEEDYIVQGAAVKTARKIYWNRGEFGGPEIGIPAARVSEIVIVYNTDFVSTIDDGVDDVDQDDPEGTPLLPGASNESVREKRTLFLQTLGSVSQLVALNRQGRVFMELLGDVVPGTAGIREHLGFEIVDIIDAATPVDLTIPLGEVVETGLGDEADDTLLPVVVNSLGISDLFFEQRLDGVDVPVLYATGETRELNEFLVYWMEEGLEGIRWPVQLSRYQFRWPDDVDAYQHFIRPEVSSASDAETTAVPLPSLNAPLVEYSDVSGGSLVEITGANRFYTYLDDATPALRSLIRYTADNAVAFERVFSWREDAIRDGFSSAGDPLSLIGEFFDDEDGLNFLNGANSVTADLERNLVVVSGGSDDAVTLLDVTDPSQPTVFYEILDGATGFGSLNGPQTVQIAGNYLFVSSNIGGTHTDAGNVMIVELTNLDAPTQVALIEDDSDDSSGSAPTQFETVAGLDVDLDRNLLLTGSNRLFNRGGSIPSAIALFDLTTIGDPQLLWEFVEGDQIDTVDGETVEISLGGFNSKVSVALGGDYAYIGDFGTSTLSIIDISTPGAPELALTLVDDEDGFDAFGGINALDVSPEDGLLAVAGSSDDAVSLLDLSDPTMPELMAVIVDGVDGFDLLNGPTDVSLEGNLLAIAAGADDAVTMIDIANPSQPRISAGVAHGDGLANGLDGASSVLVVDQQVFVTASSADALTHFQAPTQAIGYVDGTVLGEGVASELNSYDAEAKAFYWTTEQEAPRVVFDVVEVGARLEAPSGEIGSAGSDAYLPGHVEPILVDGVDIGDSYYPDAYIDPLSLTESFDSAALGAIIPVNAIPGQNEMQVWWFRENGAQTTAGFETVFWPSVIGQYTIEWPVDGHEIVMASNDGSGDLSLIATNAENGRIYYENDPDLPGYNPNEEHALMSGGAAFALRDDLNITETQNVDPNDPDYTSEPFVLVRYEATDGRPAMLPFRVRRTANGEPFQFTKEAGTVVQGPMPLPLLELPLVETDDATISLNAEVPGNLVDHADYLDTEFQWSMTTTASHSFAPLTSVVLQDPADRESTQAMFIDETTYPNGFSGYLMQQDFPDVTVVAPEPEVLQAQEPLLEISLSELPGDYALPEDQSFVVLVNPGVPTEGDDAGDPTMEVDIVSLDDSKLTVRVTDTDLFEETTEIVVFGNSFIEVERIVFDEALLGATQVIVPEPTDPNSSPDGLYDAWAVLSASSGAEAELGVGDYGSFTLQDRKGDLWIYRGRHSDGYDFGETGSVDEGDSFSIQYYYKTQSGFYFPSKEDSQPAVGSVVPYLRKPFIDDNGFTAFIGDPVDGREENGAFPITYYPVWPDDAPVMKMGETVTNARRGIDAIRGRSSLQIIYDQGIANSDPDSATIDKIAVLHDPTREKEYFFGDGLDELPVSIATFDYQGESFFPNLPPHLSERFFFDPNRGEAGALVFRGEFFDSEVPEGFVMLNVLPEEEIATDVFVGDRVTLKDLVDSQDPDADSWYTAIDGLATTLELFQEDEVVKGTFVPVASTVFGPGEVPEITDDDEAVDSYALTAVGPGTGFVTLIAENGEAFSDEGNVVDIFVIKVVDELYQGELVPVFSSNPLSEKMTMQQIIDLAGDGTANYVFEWKIAAPVGGESPDVKGYSDPAVNLLENSTQWEHLAFPVVGDSPQSLPAASSQRWEAINQVEPATVTPMSVVAYSANGVTPIDDGLNGFQIQGDGDHLLEEGVRLLIENDEGNQLGLSVTELVSGSSTDFVVEEVEAGFDRDAFSIDETAFDAQEYILAERRLDGLADSYLRLSFTTDDSVDYAQIELLLRVDSLLGARVFINGFEVAEEALGRDDSNDGDYESYILDLAFLKTGTESSGIRTHELVVELVGDSAVTYETGGLGFDLKLEAIEYIDLVTEDGSLWLDMDHDDIRAVIGGTADVKTLSDQYVTMRYGAIELDSSGNQVTETVDGVDVPVVSQWSEWTDSALAEGWIKRVLAGINPFNQRTSDFFNNAVVTESSMLTLAGPRWEGDVALNEDSINDFGLLEIYETVLNRGRGLSIDAGINYGPANDALLLVAGYINDLYMFIGNEAWADSLNPTIGLGTSDGQLGDVATALFAFKGQVPSLLEEELALLRGRDDVLAPGVEARPVYNRMFWNYTRGIDSGEVIYALNYNIQENTTDSFDGVIDAEDAAVLYPQGHGDAYGHYLTATKGYYSLLTSPDFSWVPRTEGITILGETVQVDYTDERKFANSSLALANAGKQIVDLTWRQAYQSGEDVGWSHFGDDAIRDDFPRTRYWGLDHWATRSGQGALVNWTVGNAILPAIDDNPDHQGIQIIDRSTVPELEAITDVSRDLQTTMDNAEGRLNPLGMTEGSIAFDINPSEGFHAGMTSHFEQILDRAKGTLNNAVVAFDDAKDVTRLMRSETDSLADLQASVASEEAAFQSELIDLYGTPYTDDIGPGATYETGYEGPDLEHFTYVDTEELTITDWIEPEADKVYRIDAQASPFEDSYNSFIENDLSSFNKRDSAVPPFDDDEFVFPGIDKNLDDDERSLEDGDYVEYELSAHGFFGRPESWSGSRESPGEIQQTISDIIVAVNDLRNALEDADGAKGGLDRELELFEQKVKTHEELRSIEYITNVQSSVFESVKVGFEIFDKVTENALEIIEDTKGATVESVPRNQIFGFANGGDILAGLAAGIQAAAIVSKRALSGAELVRFLGFTLAEHAFAEQERWLPFYEVAPREWKEELRGEIAGLDGSFGDMQATVFEVNRKIEALTSARARYKTLLAKGNRIQSARETFRKRAATLVQGFRSRDAAFRILRDEKLERYNTLFALAARYAYLAAQAFDYETGLLHTDEGKAFIGRIVQARALGVVTNGEPQFAGSDTGDPGISSILAEMEADWSVLKPRLGINNPDVYGTTVSLRTENFRILPDLDGDIVWRDVLEEGRTTNLLEDEDVKRYCMQIDPGDGLPVPGIVLEFRTEIMDGFNLFGEELAGGDHAFSPSTFATKIHSVGVVLEGYPGMDNPDANESLTGDSSVTDPFAAFLDPATLSATPYVYLIPVGNDVMRSPPLGDESVIRTWSVEDVTIPLPFNIGASDFSTKKLYQDDDSLTEPLFSLRKHQAFRPTSTTSVFEANAQLDSSVYTNSRLIGRSVWNTSWKLVIPGKALLNDGEQGLDVLVDHLTDIKLHLETYSYSGN